MAQITMYDAIANSPPTTLTKAILISDTTIEVEDSSVFPNPPNLLVLGYDKNDAETCLYTQIVGNVITVQRGVEKITKSFDVGTKIARLFTAKDYNSLVSSTADSSSRYVLNSASNMVNYTRANADLLKKIGISVGSDNKLTVDEDKLKASDMAVVKSVFKDSGSFVQTISAKASTIYGNAVSQLSELSTKNSYTSNGLYSYSSGYTYNQYT